MRKVVLFIFAIFYCSLGLRAQDKIQFNDGIIIDVNIIEFSDTLVKYKKMINLNGPLYTTHAENITKITFKDGTERKFYRIITTQKSFPVNFKEVLKKRLDSIKTTKRNFIRLYYTDLLTRKLSLGYEHFLSDTYSFEIDAFYKFWKNDNYPLNFLDPTTSFIYCYSGVELRSGISKHFELKRFRFSDGLSLSYREQTCGNRYYYQNWPEQGTYFLNQNKKGIGLFNKVNIPFRNRRSGGEFFITFGGYLCYTKNTYKWFQPDRNSPTIISDPTLIPPITNTYFKDGFKLLPYLNFGFDYKLSSVEKERRRIIREETSKILFKRKNVLMFDFLSLADGNIGFSYQRIFYQNNLTWYNSFSILAIEDFCILSNGTLAEQNRNYVISDKLFDVSTGLNHNFNLRQKSFFFMGLITRMAQFEGRSYGNPFVLQKYYGGGHIGFLIRAEKGFSFLISGQTGVYLNNYLSGDPTLPTQPFPTVSINKGAFFNMTLQLGYSF